METTFYGWNCTEKLRSVSMNKPKMEWIQFIFLPVQCRRAIHPPRMWNYILYCMLWQYKILIIFYMPQNSLSSVDTTCCEERYLPQTIECWSSHICSRCGNRKRVSFSFSSTKEGWCGLERKLEMPSETIPHLIIHKTWLWLYGINLLQ